MKQVLVRQSFYFVYIFIIVSFKVARFKGPSCQLLTFKIPQNDIFGRNVYLGLEVLRYSLSEKCNHACWGHFVGKHNKTFKKADALSL